MGEDGWGRAPIQEDPKGRCPDLGLARAAVTGRCRGLTVGTDAPGLLGCVSLQLPADRRAGGLEWAAVGAFTWDPPPEPGGQHFGPTLEAGGSLAHGSLRRPKPRLTHKCGEAE